MNIHAHPRLHSTGFGSAELQNNPAVESSKKDPEILTPEIRWGESWPLNHT